MNNYVEKPYNEMVDIRYLCQASSDYPLLSPEEERKWLVLSKSDDPKVVKQAFDTLIMHNLRLVISHAIKFQGRGIELQDLVQEGVGRSGKEGKSGTGLVRAIELFNLDKGTKLSTYATQWIQQGIRRALENKSRVVKIPGHIQTKITRLKKAYKAYIEDQNRPPTSEEIAEILGITVAEAQELGRWYYPHASLDSSAEGEDSLSMVNYLIDEELLPEEKLENKQDKQYVSKLMKGLGKEDRDFIRLKYGFIDNKERTPREMAQILKIPVKEVKEREQRILQTLKEQADYESVNFEI